VRTIEENEKELNELESKIKELIARKYELQKERLEIKYLDKFPVGKRVTLNDIEYEIFEYNGFENTINAKIIMKSGNTVPLPCWVLDMN